MTTVQFGCFSLLFRTDSMRKCLKLTKHLLSMVIIRFVTPGSKVTFSGSRTAFTSRSQRSRF